MQAEHASSFAALLRQHRLAAGLTQEQLAEAAGLSARAVGDLERGQGRLPRLTTVGLLASALGLSAEERAAFLAVAQPATPRAPLTLVSNQPVPAPTPASGPTSAPAPFPPLRPLLGPRHNLPASLSSFLGRKREQAEVRALLETTRLVTLTGAGGAGKTRLALRVAEDVLGAYPDGVWLVELAPLAEAALVPAAVAQTLEVREEPGLPLLETLAARLRDRHLLLVLDNCEHLIAACAEVASTLLRSCPWLHILATSRQRLEVAGEHCYRVPSLPLPDLADLPPAERLAANPAVALFLVRARERGAELPLTARNARAVAQVCARLDGIPLAIELAAARLDSLAVEGIAARLDDRFRLLTGGARDALPRQRTLRATLDWSYDLLNVPERRLLDRLAVFVGGWTLAAAEAVCAGTEDDGAEGEVLDLLGALAGKSLVQAEQAEGELRYRLLETVRQYGLERLAAAGEAEQRRDRHLAYLVALAEEAAPRLSGPEQGLWLARLEAEHDNLRAALRWALEREAGELGPRLAGALWRFWSLRGYLSEGRRWLEALLEGSVAGPAAARATALDGAGVLASMQGDHARATARLEESATLRRELGDTGGLAAALNNLGIIAWEQGDLERATALYTEALTLRRELRDPRGISSALSNLGGVAYEQGDLARAAALQEEALALQRELGNQRGVATALANLGSVAHDLGDYARATALLEESLALCRLTGNQWLGANCLEELASIIGERGQPERAARLFGAAAAARRLLDALLPPRQQPRYESQVTAARGHLDEAAFAAAWAAGAALSLEQAIAEALDGGVPGHDAPGSGADEAP